MLAQLASYTMWDQGGLHVWVSWRDDGELLIEGQDLRSGPFGATEYEYAVTVPTAQLPKLVAALGLETDDEVIAYLLANGESIVKQGERTWVEGLGITPGFWSRIEFDD